MLWIVWLLMIGSVVFGSLAPEETTADLIPFLQDVDDKAQHFFSYAILTLVPFALRGWSRAVVIPAGFVVALGFFLEFLQRFTPMRTFDTRDMAANLFGFVVGGVAGYLVFRVSRPYRS